MYGARAYHASDQAETHYARAADALGVRGIRVEQRAALAGALDAGLRGEGVTVIDVVVTRDPAAPCNHARGLPASLRSVEKILVDFFDLESILNAAPDLVVNHHFREVRAVNKNKPLAELVGCLAGGTWRDDPDPHRQTSCAFPKALPDLAGVLEHQGVGGVVIPGGK